jgi:hypothetical protein
MADEPSTLPITYAEAYALGAYPLAQLFADEPTRHRPTRLGGPRPAAPDHELQELAVMSALHDWLDGWRGLQLHRALHAGATITAVAEASNLTPARVAAIWREWDAGQKVLRESHPDMPGDDTAAREQVAALLAEIPDAPNGRAL